MIGILAPYGRNEITAAACRLADLAQGAGQGVRFVTQGTHERHVNSHWDSRVLSGRKWGAARHLESCETIVHFTIEEAVLAGTGFPSKRPAKHILVTPWHAIAPRNVVEASHYRQIVCPSRACYAEMRTRLYKDAEPSAEQLTWCRWEPGLARIKRKPPQPHARLKVCVLCDHTAIDYAGKAVLRLIEEILALDCRMDVSLLSLRSWNRADRAQLRRMVDGSDDKLRLLTGGVPAMNQHFSEHDWVVIPSVFADFGLYASRAVACGAAVIAHDVAPFNEVVVDGSTGVLVPCQIATGRFESPIAAFDVARWVETCKRAFTRSTVLTSVRLVNYHAEWRKAFDKLWLAVLDA